MEDILIQDMDLDMDMEADTTRSIRNQMHPDVDQTHPDVDQTPATVCHNNHTLHMTYRQLFTIISFSCYSLK